MKLSQVRSILNETIATVNTLSQSKPATDEALATLTTNYQTISTALANLSKRVEALEKNIGRQ